MFWSKFEIYTLTTEDPWEIDPSTVEPTTTLEPTTEDPINEEEETTIGTRTGSEEEEPEEPKKTALEPAVLALLGGLAIISLCCLTALFCW